MIDNLRQYEGERIRLTDIDGDVFEGKCCDYFFADDNSPDFEEDAIALWKPVRNGETQYQNPVQFNNSEIKSIEIIG